MKKIILRCGLAAGDIVMLTAAVRDLHRCYPGRFATDVRTCYPQLWENNPWITSLDEEDGDVEQIDCRYPLINDCNRLPHHCLHGFIAFLNRRLRLAIKLTACKGDIHISDLERSWYSQVHELTGSDTPFWIVSAGGKYDVTVKWWDAGRYQEVVDHFRGRIQFVQVGATGHYHPRLEGAIDLRGRTNFRELLRLVYHADGVLCPITALMHLAAAVPCKRPRMTRPCVVIAGGREPVHWESYPGHQFIHTIGALDCCRESGCWKDRVSPLRDGDTRDRTKNRCVDVVRTLPRCMDMISAEEVIRRINCYYEGGVLKPLTAGHRRHAERGVTATRTNSYDQQPLTLHSAGTACDRFVKSIPPCPTGFKGRGIIICGGGVRFFTCAWVCIRMLRRLGCRLPIQLWHLGRKEMDERMRALVAAHGVECVDARKVCRRHPARLDHRWALKPYALLRSSFREILLLDADNVPVVNPEYLFDSPEFVKTGAVFWPDYRRRINPKARPVWRSCGLRMPKEPEFESGQIVVDKQRCWRALYLSLWLNENSSFYYRYMHGDKDTFHLAFRKVRQPYGLVSKRIHHLKATMCQHDFDGNRLFQHRNRDKWDYLLWNRRVRGFWFEEECREYVRELQEVWDGGLGWLKNGAVRPMKRRAAKPQPNTRSILDCGSPLPLSYVRSVAERQGTAAVQDASRAPCAPDSFAACEQFGILQCSAAQPLPKPAPRIEAVMISCAERDPVRRRTLANLAQTDWPDRPVQVQMDAGEGEDRRARQTRCAYEALRAAPDSDYVLFLEDDLEFNRHLWHNLMHWRPLRERRMALAGLYNPGLREFACDRFTGSRLVTPDSVFGSQALLISREARKYIVANWNRVSGMQDIRISRLAGRLETPFYYHAPSLVQHVGKISAWGGWFHEAADFDAEWKRDKKMLTTK